MAYEELPDWLKPGVVSWNMSSVVFENRVLDFRPSHERFEPEGALPSTALLWMSSHS